MYLHEGDLDELCNTFLLSSLFMPAMAHFLRRHAKEDASLGRVPLALRDVPAWGLGGLVVRFVL